MYVALVVSVVMLAACAPDDHVRATIYAKRACNTQPPEPGAGPLVNTSDIPDMLRRYKQSARWAAKAANLDLEWNDLNQAYSTLVDGLAFIEMLANDGSPVTEEQRRQAGDITPRVADATATVRAECRKTQE
jgi:hypothetical protein